LEGKLRNMTAIYLLRGEKVLLLYRQGGRVVNDVWTGSAGGHFEKDELNDAKACVLRELYEELGLKPEDIGGLALRYIALRNVKGEIRQNYYFFANIKEHVDDNLASNEGICRWFSLEDIASLEMPLSARYVMDHFCATGRHTDRTYVCLANAERAEILELWES
jgi:8-oxo-dGTP diphosphatase